VSSAATGNPPTVPMRPWRVAMVLFVALALVLVHAHDIHFGMEHWPSSNYPMYSRIESKPRLKLLTIFGEVRDEQGTRLVWLKDQRVIPEISERRMRNILMATWDLGPSRGRGARVERLLRDYFNVYEARRILGKHAGPPLVQTHLFELTWKFRESNKPRGRPDHRRLLASSGFAPAGATSRPTTATSRPTTATSRPTTATSRPTTATSR
jgi:hypothetical protein